MCLIIDANAAHELSSSLKPILEWLLGQDGSPRLVAAGRLRAELAEVETTRKLLIALDRAGRLRSEDSGVLIKHEQALVHSGQCRSNDHHVLALAQASGARTLVTRDNLLARDFKNPAIIAKPRGRIYRDPTEHKHLLCHTSSCGIKANRRRDLSRKRSANPSG